MSDFEVEEEVAIRRTRREVFDFVADLEHLPAWRDGIHRARRTSELNYRLDGRRRTWLYEVTTREPGQRLAGRMTSKGLSLEETYAFEGPDDRMWVRLHIAGTAEGARALVEPLVRWDLRRQVRASLRRLRDVLEGPELEVEEPDEVPEEEPVTPA